MTIYRVPSLSTFEWQQRVKDKDILTPPGSPAKGDRYLINGVGAGTWTGQDKKITYYDGANWQFDTPTEGWVTWVEDENKYYYYDGSAWALLEADLSHNSLNGIQGGAATKYYHLTDTDYAALTDAHAQLANLQTDKQPLFDRLVINATLPSSPYRFYSAENVINWNTSRIANFILLTDTSAEGLSANRNIELFRIDLDKNGANPTPIGILTYRGVFVNMGIQAGVATYFVGFDSYLSAVAGTVVNIVNFRAKGSEISGGTITNRYGLYVENLNQACTNQYGVYIAAQTSGSTLNYGIYQAGLEDNYFGGKVGIGTTTPDAKLHLTDVDGGNAGITIQSPTTGTTYRSQITASFSSAPTGNYLAFDIASGATTRTEDVLFLRGDGNVGIGTPTPEQKFVVSAGSAVQIASFLSTHVTNEEIFLGQSVANNDCMVMGFNQEADYGYFTIYGIAWQNLRIDTAGGIWVAQNCSADSFTDRSPFFVGNALDQIMGIRATKEGEIDHSSLPEFVKSVRKDENGKILSVERNIGNMLSMLTVAIQELNNKIREKN